MLYFVLISSFVLGINYGSWSCINVHLDHSHQVACSLYSDRKEEDVKFVEEAIRIISEAADTLQIPLILNGGGALNALRWGSPAVRWKGEDIFNDGDLDFYAIYTTHWDKQYLYSKMMSLSENSEYVKCIGNLCTPKKNISSGSVPAMMPCTLDANGNVFGCEDRLYQGHGIFRVGVDSAYFNASYVDFYYSNRSESRKLAANRIFPLKDIKYFNSTLKIPRDFLWFFSRQVPFITEEQLSGGGPEYGRGCFSIAYPPNFLRLIFGEFDYTDLQYEEIRKFEQEAIECTNWLKDQGFESFIDCLDPGHPVRGKQLMKNL